MNWTAVRRQDCRRSFKKDTLKISPVLIKLHVMTTTKQTTPQTSIILADPFRPVESALAELNGGVPGTTVMNALKAAWKSARASAAEINRVQGGRAAGESLSAHADHMLQLLLNFALKRAGLPSENSGFAIVALGSYGRSELAPYSDIDMMILHRDHASDEQLDTLVGSILHPMWDCGLQIGHSVRCPKDCTMRMEDTDDSTLETATSLLESRFVAGDHAFSESFCKVEMPTFFKTYGRRFVEAKFQEALERWKGQSVHRTQPNIKDSPGALRDYQLAVWIDIASQLSGHLPRLKDRPLVSEASIADAKSGYERLLTLRVSLHCLCGRKQDVLDFQMQQAVAADLGCEPADDLRAVDVLLKDYYRAATAVHRLAQTVTRRYLEEKAVASKNVEKLKRVRLDDDFTRVGQYLYASRQGMFDGADWLELAMRAFVHAARQSISIGTDIAASIRARLHDINDASRCDPAPREHFETLMRMRANVGNTLRSMRDTGLLGTYLPEFSEIEGLVLSDAYHDYTVDEHTLLVVRAADDLYASVERNDRFRRSILEALPRPHILRLVCLMHDLGKSRGAAGHSERGALMVPAIGERLGLSDSTIRTLILLITEHLTLSKISQKRDTGDVAMLKELAARIGSKERLDLLFILTYCDSISVGQGSYPMWKDALLAELYSDTLRYIDNRESGVITLADAAAEEDRSLLVERLTAWAETSGNLALTREHCAKVPSRYIVEVGFDDAVLHVEAIKTMRAEKRDSVSIVRGSGELVDIWIVTHDKPRRFSQVCGAFLSEGVNVVSAIAYTRTDGIILDHFRVAPGLDTFNPDEEFWKKIATNLDSVLSGQADFLAKIESARRRIPRTPSLARKIDPVICVDNKMSPEYTVVDVKCGDRIGLLYSLSRALADLNCSIHFAKIATYQGLVTDVFYISEAGGGQVKDVEKMMNIKRLLKGIAEDYMEAKR
ncbi:MAG: [protein-PII] uridylyltransferase [Planctomycetota bacterium]